MKRKTVIFIFEDNKQKESAIDFLLNLNVNFQSYVGKPILLTSQRVFKKYYLDLYLNFKSVASAI